MTLDPGTPGALSGSMAGAMREAWDYYWPRVMPGRPDPLVGPFLDVLFVAVAQGVVRHLAENPRAFNVEITEGHIGTGEVNEIENDNVVPTPLTSP